MPSMHVLLVLLTLAEHMFRFAMLAERILIIAHAHKGEESAIMNVARYLRCILDFERSRNQGQGSEYLLGKLN